jgi:hypothetical protein
LRNRYKKYSDLRRRRNTECITVGFDVGFHLDFDIIGRGGLTLKEHHTPHPRTYLSVAVDGFPNMFQALGANSNVGAGNLLLVMERQVDYAVAATLKVQRERLKSIEAKVEAIEDFERYIDVGFFDLSISKFLAHLAFKELLPHGKLCLCFKDGHLYDINFLCSQSLEQNAAHGTR